MRLVFVSSRYGAFTGFPAWSLELRRGGHLRPGWEEEWGTWFVWGLGFTAIFKQEPGFTLWGRAKPPSTPRRAPLDDPGTPSSNSHLRAAHQRKTHETRGQEALPTPNRPLDDPQDGLTPGGLSSLTA